MSGPGSDDWRAKQEKTLEEIEEIDQEIERKKLEIRMLEREIEDAKRKRKNKELRMARLRRYEADAFLEEYESATIIGAEDSQEPEDASGENGV